MEIQNIKEKIEQARTDRRAAVFRGLVKDTPKWEDFIQHAQRQADSPPATIPLIPLEERTINGVILRNLFYLAVRDPDLEAFPETKLIRDIFDSALSGTIEPTSAFINYIGGEPPIGVHADMRETVYWQCQGTSIWEISDDSVWPEVPKVIESNELHPGDVIYLPRELKHNVIIRQPRCGIAFSFKPDRSEIHQANMDYIKSLSNK
jgi:hypothetical protein